MKSKIFKLIEVLLTMLIILLAIILFNKFSKIFLILFKVFIPFLIAFTLSFVIQPLIQKLEKIVPKKIAKVLVIAIFIIIISLFLYFCIPLIGKQLTKFIEQIPKYVNILIDMFNDKFSFLPSKFFLSVDNILSIITKYQEEILNKTMSIFESIISYFIPLIITPVLFVYFTFYYEDIEHYIKDKFCNKPAIYSALKEIKVNMLIYFKSFFIIIALLSLLSTIAFTLLGLDYTLILGLIIGITDIIPYIGPYIGGFIVCLFVLSSNPNLFIYTLIIIIVLQTIEESILVPKIQGKALKINPILVIFSVTLMGKLLGIFGMIIAVPIIRIGEIVIKTAFFCKKR